MFILLCRGHALDPTWAVAHNALCVLKRLLDNRPDVHALYEHVWRLRQGKRNSTVGPVGQLVGFAKQLGLDWIGPFQLQAKVWDRQVLDLKVGELGALSHEFRFYARHTP